MSEFILKGAEISSDEDNDVEILKLLTAEDRDFIYDGVSDDGIRFYHENDNKEGGNYVPVIKKPTRRLKIDSESDSDESDLQKILLMRYLILRM